MTVKVTHHSTCSHKAAQWGAALDDTLKHAGKTMTPAEKVSAIESLSKGEPVWHRGTLLSGD